MNLSIFRKAGLCIALSFAMAASAVSFALAAPSNTSSLFNTYDLSNRDKEATEAVVEASNQRIENVAAGLTMNAANSLALSIDEKASEELLELPEFDQVPDSVLRAASCLGVPYCSGSSSPSGFDCSGLVSYALTGEYGHAYQSYDFWSMPAVDDPVPGDVVACSAGHCGLYVGDGLMIHSPQSGEFVRVEAIRGKIVRP